MLGKLIKNDFKASAHSMLGIYLVAFVAYTAAAISYSSDNANPTPVQIILTALLIIISFAIMIIPIFQLLSYFNKSLYSNQGYLSYTLPVKSHNLLFSKAIVSFSWILLGYALFIAVYVLIYKSFASKISEEARQLLAELYATFNGPEKETILKILAVLLALVLFQIVVLISQIFFSITLSNVKPFNSFGNISGVVLFIALFLFMNSTFMRLMQHYPLSLCITIDKVTLINYPMVGTYVDGAFLIGIGGIIFQFVAMIAMFVATNYLMKKKINIK